MIRQIRYFHAVVQHSSFSKAAEACFVSQSAISQGVQSLERDLGFRLLERRNRQFQLTPAGEFFYRKSLIFLADFERIYAEPRKLAGGHTDTLKLGYLRTCCGPEFELALADFSTAHPSVRATIEYGNHDELYALLRTGDVDLVLNDQRRAFSDEYVNLVLAARPQHVDVSSASTMAALTSVSLEDLKNTPCILVSSPEQQGTEMDYYRNVVGLQGDFLFAASLDEARLMVIGGQGFTPSEGTLDAGPVTPVLVRLALTRDGLPIRRNYCAFWRQTNDNPYLQPFASILQSKYAALSADGPVEPQA